MPQHKTLDDRLAAARAFVDKFDLTVDTAVDTMDNHFNDRYSVWPERLVVLRRPTAGAPPVVVHIQETDARGGSSLWTDEAEAWLTREFPTSTTTVSN